MVIRQSFLFLLKEQTIDKITVADICRLAEINRATFYRHYENQYSVLFELEKDMLDQIQPPDGPQDMDSLLPAAFQSFYEKREDWLLLLSGQADQGFPDKLYQFFEARFQPDALSPEGQMRRRFILHGLSGLMAGWVKDGFQESAQEMTEYAVAFLHDLMGNS